jgi:23S rRNA pseudouridine1911/1915/1917 synthase
MELEPKIVYEDNDLVVIDKPSGLIVHPKNLADKSDSVSQWFADKYPESANVGEPLQLPGQTVPRPGIVHRLDRDTSGLMLLAKTEKSFKYLKELFQTRKIQKTYLTLVQGKPEDKKGIITAPLGRIGLKRTTRLKGKKMIDGKEAVTEYETIKQYEGFTLLRVMPKTGRTHQIRVHMKSIGTPVCGDFVYGHRNRKDPPGLTRLFLHAFRLEFVTPNGKKIVLETDLPEELQRVITGLAPK